MRFASKGDEGEMKFKTVGSSSCFFYLSPPPLLSYSLLPRQVVQYNSLGDISSYARGGGLIFSSIVRVITG